MRNKFLKTKTDANRKAYNRERNKCVSLFCVEKKSVFNHPVTKRFFDNKLFWETVEPSISDKNRVKNKITLIEEKTRIASDNTLVAQIFTQTFCKYCPIFRFAMKRRSVS